MAMQPRERMLAKIAGVAVLAAAVQFGYSSVQSAFDERQTRIDALQQELENKKSAEVRGKRAKKQLNEWNRRSLPADLDKARSLYQNWLANTVERIRLAKAEVTSGPAMPRLGIYNRLPFTVRGQGNLSQITQFLYEFYRADHLHQLQRFSLTPIESADASPAGGGFPFAGGFPFGGGFPRGGGGPGGGRLERPAGENPPSNSQPASGSPASGSTPPPGSPGEGAAPVAATGGAEGTTAGNPAPEGASPGGSRPGGRMGGWSMRGMASMFSPQSRMMFDVSISIEALSLPGAERKDQLNTATSDRLAFKEFEDYRGPITDRNVFAPYSKREVADESKDAFVTAVMKVDGRLQAWLSLRNWNRVRKLHEGDRIDIGSIHAVVARIRPQSIEIDMDGTRRKIALGDSLANSKELPAEEQPAAADPADSTPAAQTSPIESPPPRGDSG